MLPRVLNLEKESCDHFKWIPLEQVQHCTDLPLQVTFLANTEQEKTVRTNVTAHQEKEKEKNEKMD